jgi:putative hydrolase of the HAD superfamily
MNELGQHLIIDADDTLWEDASYFERAIEEFITFLNHGSLARDQIRSVLDEVELANRGVHPFGSRAFAENLAECYRRLAKPDGTDKRTVDPAGFAKAAELGQRILQQPRELIDGVAETLHYLARRHHLILFTKGHPFEQAMKVKSSGLAVFFERIEIARVKDAATYAELASRLGLDRARTWMVGNSPKSDINPALAVGLNAVHVPHARTWHLEHEEIKPGPGRLLVIDRFCDLRQYF